MPDIETDPKYNTGIVSPTQVARELDHAATTLAMVLRVCNDLYGQLSVARARVFALERELHDALERIDTFKQHAKEFDKWKT